jgi:hypothetical protein
VGLQYRTSRRLGSGARLTASGSGMSVSQRIGPLRLSSRGSMNLRLGRGLSYRFGRRKGLAPLFLAGMLVWWLVKVGSVLVWRAGLLGLWCARWLWVWLTEVLRASRDVTADAGTETGVPVDSSADLPSQLPNPPRPQPGLEINRTMRSRTPPH